MSGLEKHTAEAHRHGRTGWWGAFVGLVVAVLIAFPLSASIAFATHPVTQRLFGEHLAEASRAGFQMFWWLLALVLAALPFLVGFGIAKLSDTGLAVAGGVVVVFVVAVVVLGQMFVF